MSNGKMRMKNGVSYLALAPASKKIIKAVQKWWKMITDKELWETIVWEYEKKKYHQQWGKKCRIVWYALNNISKAGKPALN